MKQKLYFVAAAVALTFAARAQTWEFHLNMDGPYVGTASTGTGGDFNQHPDTLGSFPPITYDLSQHKFTAFDVGFGPANPPYLPVNGTISDPPLPMEILGPSSGGSLGPTLYSFNYNKQDDHSGSTLINFTLGLVENPNGLTYSISQQEADLHNGLWSVVVPTDIASSPGEIGGALTPVPEPQTYAMIAGLGLLGFAVIRRVKSGKPLAAS